MTIKCFLVERVEQERGYTDSAGRARKFVAFYRNVETGEEILPCHLPPGAMWFNDNHTTYNGMGVGPEGRGGLMVQTPGGPWNIDSRASNCTRTEDDTHRCWIRHGTPPLVTVDKNGDTCAAGAGSIQCGSYHGFLRNGDLVDA